MAGGLSASPYTRSYLTQEMNGFEVVDSHAGGQVHMRYRLEVCPPKSLFHWASDDCFDPLAYFCGVWPFFPLSVRAERSGSS